MSVGPLTIGADVVVTVRVVMNVGPLVRGADAVVSGSGRGSIRFFYPEVRSEMLQGSWIREMNFCGGHRSSILVVGLE